jgi:hypothetical protein
MPVTTRALVPVASTVVVTQMLTKMPMSVTVSACHVSSPTVEMQVSTKTLMPSMVLGVSLA